MPEQRDVTEQKVTLDDVIATDEVKKELRAICNALSKEGREKFKNLDITGKMTYILHGPPGNGKALIAEAIATETNLLFLSISGRELSEGYLNEYNNFLKGAKKKLRCIVFIDGIDADTRYDKDTQLAQLKELSRLKSDITLIVSARSVNALDQQLAECGYYLKEIHIPQPDKDLRKQTLDTHLKGRVEQGVSLEEIINKTEGFSLGMLHSLVNTAKFNAASRIGKTDGETYVTKDDLEDALKKLTNKNNKTPTKSDRIEKVTLDDVIVSDELKEDLKVIFDGVSEKMKENFKILGLTPAQGYLFYGPPGTGKTLLARAIAGEAKINFVNISASELVGQYAGHGIKHVCDLFETARRNSPCIIFIDEIDSIGTKHISNSSSVSQDHNNTLIQLLNEMDGFDSNKGITVIAATNRPEALDEALLRRFPEKINISLPDVSSREKILRLQMGTAPAELGLSLEEVAKKTEGYSGDDLKNLVRKVKFCVAKHTEVIITTDDFTKPLEEIRKKIEEESKQAKVREQANDNITSSLAQTTTQQVPNQASGDICQNGFR